MNRTLIKFLDVPGDDIQIVIYKNETGQFSFARRRWDISLDAYSELGPPCGLYDSVETAEKEARLTTDGLDPLPDDDTIH